jgi:hypothetical protein
MGFTNYDDVFWFPLFSNTIRNKFANVSRLSLARVCKNNTTNGFIFILVFDHLYAILNGQTFWHVLYAKAEPDNKSLRSYSSRNRLG